MFHIQIVDLPLLTSGILARGDHLALVIGHRIRMHDMTTVDIAVIVIIHQRYAAAVAALINTTIGERTAWEEIVEDETTMDEFVYGRDRQTNRMKRIEAGVPTVAPATAASGIEAEAEASKILMASAHVIAHLPTLALPRTNHLVLQIMPTKQTMLPTTVQLV